MVVRSNAAAFQGIGVMDINVQVQMSGSIVAFTIVWRKIVFRIFPVIAVLLSLLSGTSAWAESSAPPEAVHQFGVDMQTYFRSPNPKAIIEGFVDLPGFALMSPEKAYTIGAFFAQVLDSNPEMAEVLVNRVGNSGDQKKQVAIQALNMSHHPERVKLMRRLAGDDVANQLIPQPLDMRVLPILHPAHLDMMWSSFFATGNGIYVERIAGTLGSLDSIDKVRELSTRANTDLAALDQMRKVLIAQAAAWSLEVNSRNYPEVRAALAQFASTDKTAAAGIAAVIVTRSQPK